jgi:hypothetical protein
MQELQSSKSSKARPKVQKMLKHALLQKFVLNLRQLLKHAILKISLPQEVRHFMQSCGYPHNKTQDLEYNTLLSWCFSVLRELRNVNNEDEPIPERVWQFVRPFTYDLIQTSQGPIITLLFHSRHFFSLQCIH